MIHIPIMKPAISAKIPIAFVGIETSVSSSGTSRTTNVPAGVVDGDVMLAFVQINDAGMTINTEPGWTLVYLHTPLGITVTTALYIRVASSEPASYTWDGWSSSRNRVTHVAYRNVDAANIIDVYATTPYGVTSTVVAPSVTTTTVNTMMVVCIHVDDTSSTGVASYPGSMTERQNTTNVNATQIYDEPIAATGATGTRTFTLDFGKNGEAVIIALGN